MTCAPACGVVHPASLQPARPLYSRALRRREAGQALLIVILMTSVALAVLAYGATSETARAVKAESHTRAVLEYARQALIGRALGDANRPGSLPCPDGGDDGSADLFAGTHCPSYLGRLPWRTLGVGDLRDAHGERLWYALSPNFRDHPLAPALNSDTQGTLTVYSMSDATRLASHAIAIVFAPGAALPGQRRDDVVALCGPTAKNVRRSRCAANYLDTAASASNNSAGPYITTPAAAHFNDQLALIVAADLMPLLEQRVALEARNALLAYRIGSACACYPWADGTGDGVSDRGVNRGRIPATVALPHDWPAGTLPAWFAANDWPRVIHYAVARSALELGGRSCTTCTHASLAVDGAGGHDVVLITAGHAAPGSRREGWADYLDDAANRDGDDRYVTPHSQAADRDRIYTILGAAAAQRP